MSWEAIIRKYCLGGGGSTIGNTTAVNANSAAANVGATTATCQVYTTTRMYRENVKAVDAGSIMSLDGAQVAGGTVATPISQPDVPRSLYLEVTNNEAGAISGSFTIYGTTQLGEGINADTKMATYDYPFDDPDLGEQPCDVIPFTVGTGETWTFDTMRAYAYVLSITIAVSSTVVEELTTFKVGNGKKFGFFIDNYFDEEESSYFAFCAFRIGGVIKTDVVRNQWFMTAYSAGTNPSEGQELFGVYTVKNKSLQDSHVHAQAVHTHTQSAHTHSLS